MNLQTLDFRFVCCTLGVIWIKTTIAELEVKKDKMKHSFPKRDRLCQAVLDAVYDDPMWKSSLKSEHLGKWLLKFFS